MEVDIEFEKEDEQLAKPMKDPGPPSASELERHLLSHIPLRSWCAHCVAGRARHAAHRRRTAPADYRVPHVVADYGLLGGYQDAESLVVQVARDVMSGFLFSHVVPRRGAAHVHGAAAFLGDIRRLGHDALAIKADNEPAMRSLQEEVQQRREQSTLLENSPVGQSQAIGVADRAVQAASKQSCVMSHALQNPIDAVLPVRHPVMAWMVELAAELLSAFQRGPDGRTAYEIIRGKPYKRNLAEFAEKVAYRIGKLENIKKLEARWSEDIILSANWRAGEAVIGLKDGFVCSSAILRHMSDLRWPKEDVPARGVPWLRKHELEEYDQWEVLRLPQEQPAYIAGIPAQEEPQVRRMRLRREAYECTATLQGIRVVRHCSEGVAPQTADGGHGEELRERPERKTIRRRKN